MTAKEYLSQAKLLDGIINCQLQELEYWRDLSCRVSGGGLDEHYNPNRPTGAPFVRCLEKIDEIEKNIDIRIDELITLRNKINRAIDTLENPDEQMILRCRYLENCSWSAIADKLHVSNRTVHRIHSSALASFPVPE